MAPAREIRLTGALVMVLAARLVSPATGSAQGRQPVIDSALTLPDAADRVQALLRVIDPNRGPPDQRWVRAVARMVEDLSIEFNDPNAALWLRWAVRWYPQFAIDPVETEPQVLALLERVRREVGDLSTADTLATWDWAGAARSGSGRLRLNRIAVPDDVSVLVTGRGQLTGELTLPAGTYDVTVSGTSTQFGTFQREVLPGVTTILNLRLPMPVAAAAPGGPDTPPGPGQIVPRTRGGFPVVALLGGLGLAGAAAALLLGGGGSTDGGNGNGNPTTGGIIINYPIP